MKTINELLNEHTSKKIAYRKEEERLNKRIENAQKRLKKHHNAYPYWTIELVKPICEAIAQKEHLCLDEDERYLTFGLRGECPVFFKDYLGKRVGGITFTYDFDDDNGARLFYDTGKRMGIHERGSIGYLNGFDNIVEPLPNTLEEIIEKCLYKRA